MSDSSPGTNDAAAAAGRFGAGYLAVAIPPLPTRYRILTFSAGFLCGQASLILVAVLFLRYVVFEDPKVALREAGKRRKKRMRNTALKRQRRPSITSRNKASSGQGLFSAILPQSDAILLSKLGYDLSAHGAESADWLNVLVAQAVSAYRNMLLAPTASTANSTTGGNEPDADDLDEDGWDASNGSRTKRYVEKELNSVRGKNEKASSMVTLDYITVTDCDFGQDYPVVSNARVRPSNETGKVRIEVDIDYSDHVGLSIETKVFINFPKPKFAIIPISLAVALARFSATLTLEIPPASTEPSILNARAPDSPLSMPEVPKTKAGESALSLSLHPDFILELAITSIIGSRAKLQNIPKVEQLILGRVRAWISENLVWPKVKTIKLPSFPGFGRSSKQTDSAEYDATLIISRRGSTVSPADEADRTRRAFRESTVDSTDALSPSIGSALDDDDDEDDMEVLSDSMQLLPRPDGGAAALTTPPNDEGSASDHNPRSGSTVTGFTSALHNDAMLRPYARANYTRIRRRSSMASSDDANYSSAISMASSDRPTRPLSSAFAQRAVGTSQTFRTAYRDAVRRSSDISSVPELGSVHTLPTISSQSSTLTTPRHVTPLLSPGLGIAQSQWNGGPYFHSLATPNTAGQPPNSSARPSSLSSTTLSRNGTSLSLLPLAPSGLDSGPLQHLTAQLSNVAEHEESRDKDRRASVDAIRASNPKAERAPTATRTTAVLGMSRTGTSGTATPIDSIHAFNLEDPRWEKVKRASQQRQRVLEDFANDIDVDL